MFWSNHNNNTDEPDQKPKILKSKVHSIWSGSTAIDNSLIVSLMMPLYYTEDKINSDDIHLLTKSWDAILTDRSPVWINIRNHSEFKSSLDWFQHKFYNRLFDIHPFCKKMFRK